jgi:hypothetical protein
MAEETDDISIKVAIDSADADKSIKEIKQSLKDLKNVKAGDKLFEDAQKAATKYREKLDDIKDAAGAAAGSGVEKLTSSMNLLKDGFVNADPGKLSIGMKGLGMAMKAIPIFLIIEGIKFLVENFEKLASGGGIVGKVFTFIGEVISATIQYFKDLSDQLGLTNFALEDNADRVIAAAKATEAATTSKYDAEIKMAKAAGKETIELEIKKQEAVIKSLQLQQKALEILASSTGQGATPEQIKKWAELEELVKAATLEIGIIKTTAETKANADAKKLGEERNKIAEDNAKKLRDLETANIDEMYLQKRMQILNQYADEAAKYKGQTAILVQLAIQRDKQIKALNEQKYADQETALQTFTAKSGEIEQKGIDASNFKQVEATKAYGLNLTAREHLQALSNKNILEAINSLASSTQTILSAISDYNQSKADEAVKVNEQALQTQLTDLDAAREAELNKEGLTADQKVAIENKYKQQKYELELQEYNNNTKIKRKAFEQDKKMKIAQAVISTITGAIAAVTGMIQAIPGPVGIILGVVAGLAVTAAGVLQVAKINNTTFDAGTPPSPPTLNVPSASSVSTGSAASSASATPSFDWFKKDTNQNGVNNNASSEGANQPMVVKAYVVSQEITDQQTANNYSTSMGSL